MEETIYTAEKVITDKLDDKNKILGEDVEAHDVLTDVSAEGEKIKMDEEELADLKRVATEVDDTEENLGREYVPVELVPLTAMILRDINRINAEEDAKLPAAEKAANQINTEEDLTTLTYAEIEEILLNTQIASELYNAELELELERRQLKLNLVM